MYCSTCGSRVSEGRAACQVCGAAVARMQAAPPYAPVYVPQPSYAAMGVQVCPRCGYRGVSTSYFSRGGHVVALAAATLMFAPAAIVYLLLRHNHRVCPNCGLGWGPNGVAALTLLPNGSPVPSLNQPALPAVGGTAKRGWAILLFILGGILAAGGIAGMAFAPIVMGIFALAGGGLLMRGEKRESERRREAIIQSLQLPVMQLAARKGGRLTVTDVATEMQWPMARAEKVLNSLDDGMRVMSDITNEGVIVYDFLEIRTAGLRPGNGGDGLGALRA